MTFLQAQIQNFRNSERINGGIYQSNRQFHIMGFPLHKPKQALNASCSC